MLMMMMMLMMLMSFSFVVDHSRVTCYPQTRKSHVTLGRASHDTQGKVKQRRSIATPRVESSHPEQEGLSLETCRSEVQTRIGSATLCCVGLASFTRC